MATLEQECKMADICLTADKLKQYHHNFYTFGDISLAPDILQLAVHYQEITGNFYHHAWNKQYNGLHK